jgi:ketosteroid isomerase-like protein
MKRWSTIILVLVSLAVAACRPAPAALSEQDKAAIRAVTGDVAKYVTAAKPDFAAYVKHYYTEDATVLTSNMPPVKGHGALQAFFAAFPPMSSFTPEIVDIGGQGDLAYVRGNYAMTMNPPGAAPVTDKGKYIEVWKKQADGSWKSAYDSFTSDLPAEGFAVPTGVVAADASPEVKRLAELQGHWQFSGTLKADPAGAPMPANLGFHLAWFAGGHQMLYRWDGTIGSAPYVEFGFFYYDARTKSYAMSYVMPDGSAGDGTLAITPGTWTFEPDGMVGDKPAKFRFVLSDMTPSGGSWKNDVSVAGGPRALLGEGKYVKVP